MPYFCLYRWPREAFDKQLTQDTLFHIIPNLASADPLRLCPHLHPNPIPIPVFDHAENNVAIPASMC